MPITGVEMEIPPLNVFEMFSRTCAEHREKTATIFYQNKLTYGELFGAVLGFMGKLQESGVKPSDRVGIMLPNCPQYLISYYAVTGMGAIVVQINPMSAAPELEFFLKDSGCETLIVYDKLAPLVKAVPSRGQLKSVVAVRLGASDESLPEGTVWFDEWLATATRPGKPCTFDSSSTIAVLQYTGGTTGSPKAAMLTHKNLVANAYQTSDIFPGGFGSQDMVICALPLFHVYAMTICMNLPVLKGASMLIVPRFMPGELLSLIEQNRPTMFPAVPTMYVAMRQILPKGSTALDSIRLCNSGGAPLPKHVMLDFEQATGALVLEGYGLSEAAPVTHFNMSLENRKVGSIGRPIPSTEAKIVSVEDPTVELGVNEPGELAVRGPQIMLGYWNRPDDTTKTLTPDGWLLTGDIATVDEDGYAFIVDRKKDLIIASGYNVYPRDVEEVLYKHPAILEAAVVGVPDEYRGENVKAFLVAREGHQVTEQEMAEYCRSQLAAYKVPRMFEFRTELPKTAVGKILRRALK